MSGSGDRPNQSRKKILILLVLTVITATAAGYYWWSRGRLTTDDAFVDGRVFSITPRISGYVTDVFVADNVPVKTGQPLLALDRTEYEVALAEAKAALLEAEATLTSLELGVPLERDQTVQRVRAAQAQLDSLGKTLERTVKEEEAAAQDLKQAEARHEQALLNLTRIRELARKAVVSQSMLDEATTAAATTLAQVRGAQARLESVRKQRASLAAETESLKANIDLAATGQDVAAIKARQVEAQKARVESAKARVRQAELNLEYTTIAAPADGYVTKKGVEPGQMVSRGQPLMAVVPLDPTGIWITANYKETQLTDVRPGLPVTVRIDTYPGLKLKGTVASIMAGTGAAFSLFPPENASGNYVKVVQRIPVKIVLDEANLGDMPPLRIGMSVVPTIFTDR